MNNVWSKGIMNREVSSEMPGVFYRSPTPGEPPHAQVGDRLSPDSVIGVVELMKQFNEVCAGVSGVLREFLVADGDAVDVDMVLAIVSEEDGKP